MNYLFIVMSVGALEKMDEALGDEELTLKFWLQCHKPYLFAEDLPKETFPIETVTKFRKLGKVDFFKIFMDSRELRRQLSKI